MNLTAIFIYATLAYFFLFLVLLGGLVYSIQKAIKRYLMLKESKLTSEIKITNEAVELLDESILFALDQYKILTLIPKQIYYINNALENEIIEELSNTVPDMLSPLLLTKLGYLYSQTYIPTLIGTRIYLAVLDFVLEYNTENAALQEELPKNKNTVG